MLNEPVVDRGFFGRKDVLGVLEKRVNALKGGYRQNVALTGQMLSGKSSILYQFLYTLKDTSLIPIYIELTGESFSSFTDRFIATLLYNYLVSCSMEVQKDLEILLRASETFIPRTVYAIKKVKIELSKRRYNEAYKKLLSLTSILKDETGKSCVVILDEFHNLESFKIKKPYLHFGKIMMIQKDTMYIVSSSQKSTIKKILSEKLALLYGNFEIIEVSGFDYKTAEAFIREKLEGIVIDQNYIDYLIAFTDGNPFYLDAILKKAKEIINVKEPQSLNKDVLIEAFTVLFHNASGTLNQYFTNNIMSLLEKGLREDFLDILIAIADGFNKLKDIAGYLKKKSTAGLGAKLTCLIELDLLYKNGVFYELHDSVFRFWLRSVYHKKKTSLIDNIVEEASDFKKLASHDIGEYMDESRKDILERIKDLFSLFNGETVEIEKRKRRLPRFAKIDFQQYGTRQDMLTYQKSDKYWVCEVWRGKVDESGISDFIERYYPMRDKVGKKVCVALEGIDTNALLLAKEKNVWIWDLKSLNSLLRLYKRHNLIYK